MPIPELASWKVESLRLTLFISEPIDPASQKWWQSLTTQEPETVTSKRQTGDHVEEGVFGDWRLTLNINSSIQNRIDWMALPIAPALQDFSTIGNYSEESNKFIEMFNKWIISDCPPSFRLAYGVVLLNSEPNKDSTYETLASCLPMIKFNKESWTEFGFQINNQTSSDALPSSKLNVVSRWNGIKMVRVVLDPTSNLRVESHATRLELDISTSAESNTILDPKTLINLFSELKVIADKYASEGYQE